MWEQKNKTGQNKKQPLWRRNRYLAKLQGKAFQEAQGSLSQVLNNYLNPCWHIKSSLLSVTLSALLQEVLKLITFSFCISPRLSATLFKNDLFLRSYRTKLTLLYTMGSTSKQALLCFWRCCLLPVVLLSALFPLEEPLFAEGSWPWKKIRKEKNKS